MSVTIAINNNNSDFEFNLSNSNFYALWSALNLFIDDENVCGSISAIELEKALEGFKVSSLTSKTYQDGNFISFGRTQEQVTRYYWSLRKLVQEAKELNQAIVWA